MLSTVRFSLVAALACALQGCNDEGQSSESPPAAREMRIYYNPYAEVDWGRTQRLLAQHHDHVGTSETRISAYDNAGYQVVGLQHYSGNPILSYAWTERRWPPETWVTSTFRSSLRSIRFFIPNAEEVGAPDYHYTSPFLTTYIEGVPLGTSPLAPHQFTDVHGMINRIAAGGGVPCMAHPWLPIANAAEWSDVPCMEIYSAFAEGKREQGDPMFTSSDANAQLVANWDAFLRLRPRTLGIAVNDHFGPYAAEASSSVRDSGKILVFASDATLTAYERAFRRGAFVAIRELVPTKGDYPKIEGLSVEARSVFIATTDAADSVTWIASGVAIANTAQLEYSRIPRDAAYVRAEVRRSSGAMLYTQAFEVRQVGDNDGDGDVDAEDEAVCGRVRAGADATPEHIAACAP